MDSLIYQEMLIVIIHPDMFDIKATCPLKLILGDGFLNLLWQFHAKKETVSRSPAYI